MISRRRLKRQFKRVLIPVETLLVWTAGLLALGLYWAAHGLRVVARLLWRV